MEYKTYKSTKDAISAFQKAASLRERWEYSVRNKESREEMEKKGLKTAVIGK